MWRGAAGAARDRDGARPHVLQARPDEAEMVLGRRERHYAAGVERVVARLERVGAAIAGRPQGRGLRLHAERQSHHAGADGGGRAARRAAGRARRVVGIAGRAGIAAGELGRDRLADDHGAGLRQGPHRRRVALRLPAGIERAVHLGREIDRLDHVLHGEGRAVDGRERAPRGPACRRDVVASARRWLRASTTSTVCACRSRP